MFKKAMSLILLLLASAAGAVTYTGDSEYTAGSGSNSATIAIDFDSDSSFLFTYEWDGTATGWDALLAIESASVDFVMPYTDFGWGIMVDDFNYPGGVEYDYIGAGDTTGAYYWLYYVGDNTTWSESMVGMTDRVLNDGDWDSWVWTNSYGDWPNSVVREPGQVAVPVPEPMTVALLGLGGLFIRKFRR